MSFWKRNNPSLWLTAGGLVALISFEVYRAHQIQKPAPLMTKAQIAQNKCASDAYRAYNEGQLAVGQRESELIKKLQSHVETILMHRRLQEKFCQEFVDCLAKDQANPLAQVVHSAQFNQCLLEEEGRDVDNWREIDSPQEGDPPSR